MQRSVPYLGIVAALLLGALAVAFSNSIMVFPAPAVVLATASSTLSVAPGLTVPPVTVPSLELGTNTPAAPSSPAVPVPEKVVPPAPKPVPVVSPSPAHPVASTPAPSTPSGNSGLDASATALRGALVNIVCYVPPASGLHSISGSGVIIDSKGIILTNAHVAQYFLLADRGASCIVRAGSPAADKYDAALMYISPLWLRANANVLTQAAPSGTGQYDFALLAITRSATSVALPAQFPSLPLAQTPPSSGTPVVIASYGAQFLGTSQIQSSLFPTVVFGSVKDVFTFGTNTIDVLALGGSAAAQEGSSGGGVADASGFLAGTITTSTVDGATATRSLDAITASYIRGEYASEMGSALDILLAEPTATAVSDFSAKIPTLEAVITAQLP